VNSFERLEAGIDIIWAELQPVTWCSQTDSDTSGFNWRARHAEARPRYRVCGAAVPKSGLCSLSHRARDEALFPKMGEENCSRCSLRCCGRLLDEALPPAGHGAAGSHL